MKRLVLHPFFWALSPILFLYGYNQEQLPAKVIALPLVTALAMTAAFWVGLRWVLKDGRKAGLYISFLLLWFFSYGHCYSLVSGWYVGEAVIGRDRFLYPCWGIVLVVGVFFISRIQSDRKLADFSSCFNIISLSSVFISLLMVGGNALNNPPNLLPKGAAGSVEGGRVFSSKETLPDIYYIILDSYGSRSTLKDYFHFDNGEFVSYLAQKGFYVAEGAHSNYASTLLSLSSSLNMDYINGSIAEPGESSRNDRILRQMVMDNSVERFLRAKGYRIINISSGWESLPFRGGFGGEDDASSILSEGFSWLLLDTTVLRMFRERFLENSSRQNILQAFQRLSAVAEEKGPKFILAHILCPHPPFVFGPDGERVSSREKIPGLSRILGHQKQLYVAQLLFTNREVAKAIETILAKSSTPPVILLQGDHGCAYVHNPEVMDSRKPVAQNLPDKVFLAEQMSIFSAYYVPKDCRNRLYPSITPVNSFRAVFNYFFNEDFPLLEEHTYYSTHKRPYEFVDVTEKLMTIGTANKSPSTSHSPNPGHVSVPGRSGKEELHLVKLQN